MRYRNGKISLRFLRWSLSLALSISAPLPVNASVPVSIRQTVEGRTSQSKAKPQTDDKPSVISNQAHKIEKGERSNEPGVVNDPKGSLTPRECRDLAMSLLEMVQLGADRIKSTEYKILTQVEAATLLWQIDRERAFAILKTASEKMRELKEKEPDTAISGKQRRLRFLAFLKIARLKPDLVKDLALNKSNGKAGQALSADWTEETRAIITTADEQIDKDPARAAQLARQAFNLGQVDWAGFLRKLSMRDSALSEQLAVSFIDRLRGSSLSPLILLNLNPFVLSPGRSERLKGYFFESLAIRLRRVSGSPAPPPDEIYDSLVTSEEAIRMAANYPRWQAEFAGMNSALQELMKAGSVADPRAGNNKVIPIPAVEKITPRDTSEIIESLPRVERMSGSKVRDGRYREAATRAALSSDLRLAEEIISKIEDEGVRCDTTMRVFGPFARKAIAESDWPGARDQASKILDPLGRTLVLDRIARGMSQAGKDKQSVLDVYRFASYRLQRESPTETVAKAFLIVAKSLSAIDPDEGLDATSWGVHILNKLSRNGELQDDFKVGEALAPWVKLTGFFFHHDEALDLTELIGPVFQEIARRDVHTAESIANGFGDQGLYSFAQLGIIRTLLEKARDSKGTAKQQQRSRK